MFGCTITAIQLRERLSLDISLQCWSIAFFSNNIPIFAFVLTIFVYFSICSTIFSEFFLLYVVLVRYLIRLKITTAESPIALFESLCISLKTLSSGYSCKVSFVLIVKCPSMRIIQSMRDPNVVLYTIAIRKVVVQHVSC